MLCSGVGGMPPCPSSASFQSNFAKWAGVFTAHEEYFGWMDVVLHHIPTASFQSNFAKWAGVFAAHEEYFGWMDVVLHHIPTGNAPASRERYCPLPPGMYTELQSPLKEGDFSFPLESVQKLKDLMGVDVTVKQSPRLAKTSTAAVCNNPDLPAEFVPLCKSKGAATSFFRLGFVAARADLCEICTFAACTGCH
ncbi:hypothetical protein SKAU_G00159330 [Synaphobranchus kaupii]|uniref:Guanylate cyclase activator 2B n=1 Tax=Synaphobranchus kaupii TaxID=118154 RepID=A0A9Q1FI69_SYNKA|nr:hypothetical protein SKAU_G00159330 [Synaphobranchus kaupii]